MPRKLILTGILTNENAKDLTKVDIPDAGSLSILVAEDNPINQKIIGHMLAKMGCTADYVCNGVEAIEVLRSRKYDVVLMDVQMPEMDGLEATRRIRQELSHQPRIVAMTAGALQSDREECLEAGMDAYITKPINLSDLKELLENARPV